ncbi:SRA stem-loop-interacting RNA-binding protein, mitochondrial [Ornithorhynchus anatinus]|uniref:SRA stem-loop-interacting RNA-binding protein, mitochondrial n=1 Tax=Ornithorhynchus anatinus TaxID=9258 RepID=UPI000155C5E9|nr:SRA stem-loop-interacting RNA-binding protein, mitochondrial [Ornithorhynchus anatinus]
MAAVSGQAVGRAAWGLRGPVLFVTRLPWTAATGEIKEHFSQFGHIRRCLLPFDKETGFHRGFCWVGFSSEEELQNALQHESHLIDGVKLYVQRQQYRKAFSNPPKKDQGDY